MGSDTLFFGTSAHGELWKGEEVFELGKKGRVSAETDRYKKMRSYL